MLTATQALERCSSPNHLFHDAHLTLHRLTGGATSTPAERTITQEQTTQSEMFPNPSHTTLFNTEETHIKKTDERCELAGAWTKRTHAAGNDRHSTYFLSRGNGAALVEPVLDSLGWKRSADRQTEVKLRWTECSQQINYSAFKDGEHMVNHIPNCGLLTNKLGLLLSLRDFERRHQAQFGRPPMLTMHEFFPQTFIVDDRRERQAFFDAQQSDDSAVWISKPIGLNQGKGIFLVRDMDAFRDHLEKRDNEARSLPAGLPPRLIQRYITKPLLLNGRKFDIRCFMLVANVMPYLVLYYPGYARLSLTVYSVDDPNLLTHLTNQYMQKKDPQYAEVKNDTVWSMDRLNDYVNENYRQQKNLPLNWVKSALQWRIQRIIYHTFLSVKNRLTTRLGMFELYGLDFILDEDLHLWLLEVNSNPAMNTNCDVLKTILPNLIEKTIHISLECFEKARQDKPLLPLTGVPKYLHASQRSNRPLRASLDGSYGAGKSEPDCRVQGFGLPDGFSLLYNESPAAFRTRWPIAHSNILRGWIVPRYRPSVPGFNEKSHLSTFSLHQMTLSTDALANEPRRNSELPLQSFGSIAPYRQSFNILTTIDRQPHNQQNTTSQSAPSKLMQSMQLNNSPKHRYFECNLRRYPQSHNLTKNTCRISLTVTDIKLPKPISDHVFEVESSSHCSSLIKVPTPTKPMIQNKPTDAEATDTSDIEVSEPMDDPLRLESLTHRAPDTATSTTREQTQPNQQSSGHISRPTIPMATVKLYSVSNKPSDSITTKVSRPSVKSIVCSIRQDKRSAPVTTYWSQPASLQTAPKILSSSSLDRMKHKLINSKLQDYPRASLHRGS